VDKSILAVLALLAIPGTASAAHPSVGRTAPEARIETVDHDNFDLSSLRGQVVVINFWATWCGPCRQELPLLDRYYRARKARGLVVLAATTEDSLPESRMKGLFDRLAITPLHRIKGPYAPLGAVPTNFVIDRAGVLRYAKAGALTAEDLDAVVTPLLRQSAPQLDQDDTTAANVTAAAHHFSR
jgi:cytochrome c biogenesis protein CcmG, thiol:disulfide interchange protein DsbE